MGLERAVVWKRLDIPGMDACQFRSEPNGWAISGTAIFIADGSAGKLTYDVACRRDWSTRTASVSGWTGKRNISLMLERPGATDWHLNGAPINGTSALADIDLGFTPATNTNAIKRLDLQEGQEVETTALWLDTSDWMFKPLRQIYRHKSDTLLAYASPLHRYQADITIDPFGVIVDYPGLWAAATIEAYR